MVGFDTSTMMTCCLLDHYGLLHSSQWQLVTIRKSTVTGIMVLADHFPDPGCGGLRLKV